MPPSPETPSPRNEDALRPHSYDGIQEFDKRLPNWWLMTLYGAIVFSVVYWFVHFESHLVLPDGERVKREMDRIDAIKLAALVQMLNDDNLWKMSQNEQFVAAGAATYKGTCASCHGDDLKGKIGPGLTDTDWIHGGLPTQVFNTVKTGVAAKGMPSWGPLLGDKRVAEVVAFVMNRHKPGEPIRIVPSPTAGAAPPAP